VIKAFDLGLNSDKFIYYITEVVLLHASFTVSCLSIEPASPAMDSKIDCNVNDQAVAKVGS